MSYIDLAQFTGYVDRIEEAPIDDQGRIIGWHSYLFSSKGEPLAGGTSHDRTTARRIGIAELIERFYFKKILQECPEDFLIYEYKSTCGFAFGFDNEKTRLRSLCEAIERWAWSQWIDYHYHLPQLEITADTLSPLSHHFYTQFDEVHFHGRPFTFKLENRSLELYLVIAIGMHNGRLFAGSRVGSKDDNIIEHALTELWRHKLIVDKGTPVDDFFTRRLFYFSENPHKALAQIQNAVQNCWPDPELLLQKQYTTAMTNGFLWRTLCKNYLSWHEGSAERFVY